MQQSMHGMVSLSFCEEQEHVETWFLRHKRRIDSLSVAEICETFYLVSQWKQPLHSVMTDDKFVVLLNAYLCRYTSKNTFYLTVVCFQVCACYIFMIFSLFYFWRIRFISLTTEKGELDDFYESLMAALWSCGCSVRYLTHHADLGAVKRGAPGFRRLKYRCFFNSPVMFHCILQFC